MSASEMPQQLGRYKIVRELGKGAMGVVYEGLDPNIGRRVAIKTARRDVLSASANAEEMMERFLREARAAGALNHPNIITIYDADEENGIAYIAMEYLEGGDLRDVLEKHKQLDPEDIVDLGAAVCEALACAHERGVVHRDIKPANVMMPSNAPAKVADFGIAHMSDSTLTQEGALIGTPFYMSPEQFMGKKVDGRSDLFSVAVMLYELCTGEKPFTGEALSTVMHHVIRTDPVPPHELNFNISEPLSRVILKSMSKRPADRYPDGRAMAVALRESIKPNPNPALLQLAPRGDDSGTVVSGGGADATVITTPRQTLPPGVGVASPADAATVTTSGRLADTASSDAQARTIAGGPPPGVDNAPVTVAVAHAPAAEWTRPPRLYIALGAAAAVLIILAALVTTLGGGGEPQNGTESSAANTTTAAGETPLPEKYLKSTRITVFRTADLDLYEEYMNQPDLESSSSFVRAVYDKHDGRIHLSEARVGLWNADRTKELTSAIIGEEGGQIKCPGNPEKVHVYVWIPGQGQRAADIPADARFTAEIPWNIEAKTAGEDAPMRNILVLTTE